MKQITVRSGKGNKDRVTTFSSALTILLNNHLRKVKTLHQKDLELGFGAAYLPYALERKYPATETECDGIIYPSSNFLPLLKT